MHTIPRINTMVVVARVTEAQKRHINGIFLRHFALEMAPVDFCPFFRVMVVGRVPPPKADE